MSGKTIICDKREYPLLTLRMRVYRPLDINDDISNDKDDVI